MRFAGAAEWEEWLAANHTSPDGAWLLIAKKGSPEGGLRIGDALDVALCYGWIDSHRRAHDERSYLQRYSRRRKGSPWSRVNVDRAEALVAADRMRPPGHAEIAAARADGRWDAAYTPQSEAGVPSDLAAALAASPAAAARFEALGKTARYRLVLPLLKARTPATRARRLDKAVAELLDG